ncbi:hypothetical protein LOD99_315 [Oopsacas minuta]|uniref:Uncharacterized protein n=1 Tax=Oopsacas minuta TaxID=111878 RepID=A0AAV7K8L6_9METZ|nr:hypothetical protein LOD99_315 [Oopsacas minuta]
MEGTLKRFTAPVRYLRRYTNPFWKWADRLEVENIWDMTLELYDAKPPKEHDIIHSMICMCKKIKHTSRTPVSEDFHSRFYLWEVAIKEANLIHDTLKLHKISDMETLESRLYSLLTVSSRCDKGFTHRSSASLEMMRQKNSASPDSLEFSTSPVKRLASIQTNQDNLRVKPLPKEVKSMFESLNALTKQSIFAESPYGFSKPHDDVMFEGEISLPDDNLATNPPVSLTIPDSFRRKYSSEMFDNLNSQNLTSNIHTPSLPSIQQSSVSSKQDLFLKSTIPDQLKFPYNSNPLETILKLTQEIVEAKLSLKPEAWLLRHFLTSTWEMFHFGEETIGNFIIAPNYLRDENEEPSLDIFFWSGNPANLSFYACPIHRDKNGFFLHESEHKFGSLVSLVTHYIFNLTEDIPVLLQHPYLTELIPSCDLPDSITVQEMYLIRILEYHPECWLTQDKFDESNLENLLGAFIIHEDLSRDVVKLYVKVDMYYGLKVESFEINTFDRGFGLVNSTCRFVSFASLLAHYCCWPTQDIPCLLKIPICLLPENDTVDTMQLITNIVEEVYIARDLSLHPHSWFQQNTKSDDQALALSLSSKPLKTFIVYQYKDTYALMLNYPKQESPIQSYNIVKSDQEFAITPCQTWFPSLPLLIAYHCRNEDQLIPLLSIPKFTSADLETTLIASVDEDSQPSLHKIGRKSVKLDSMHRRSSNFINSPKALFELMQQLVITFTENPTVWKCSNASEAIERIRQQDIDLLLL